MRTLKITVLAGAIVAFAAPAFACGAGHSESAQTMKPTTTATAPITPKPSGTGG